MLLGITRSNGCGVELRPLIRDLLAVSQPDDFITYETSKLAAQLDGAEPIIGQLTRTVTPVKVGRHALGSKGGFNLELVSGDIALPTILFTKLTQRTHSNKPLYVILASLRARQLL